ncbi:CRP-like cAMP-binding protein [Aliiruegeria haliotis]|uniref:CRP-like cAMP-binding protein n=1 Tax=Aliiruegeria haliotis TaxID=1280846 RepID=A0A2T0RN33_9RHOB|nr:Crp/Fnr family transcriptional regulator [Aliiruegeria haliotis]PRY22616.1 CRP-like cAMP-binding protein [Aliiruegeria haliotis]
MQKVKKYNDFDEVCAFLGRVGWLAECPRSSRDLIFGSARLVRFAEDEPVYRMGDRSDGVYGFVDGGLQIMLPRDNQEIVPIHLSEPGFWVGESAFFSDSTRLVSVVATRPTVGLHVPRASVIELLESHPDIIQDFYALSHRNLATALKLLANLTIANSTSRIAQRLVYYDEIAGKCGAPIRLTQEDLANLVAVSLPTVERVLRGLGDAGAVETGRGQIRVLDRRKLISLSYG